MKYTVININRAEDVPEIPEDVKVIGVDYTWKYYPNLFNVYFTRLDALIEFIAAGIDRYGIPMCADELNKDSNKNGRFHMLRNFIRYRKILYYSHEGDAVTVMRNVMAGNQYIETQSFSIQKVKTQQTVTQQLTTPVRKSEIIHRMRNDVIQPDIHVAQAQTASINTPLVSVILPHYNRAELVKKSIESLVNQTYQKLEILIVDDCSDKDQFDSLVEYLSLLNDERVHLYKCNKNVGPYVCKNEMFKIVKGEYVTMQDSDDTSASDRIEKQVYAMSNEKVSVCYVNTYRGKTKYHQCLAAAMYKKHVLSDIGFFDTVRYGADSEFNERVRTYYGAIRVVTINEHLYFTGFDTNCLTNKFPHDTKDRNDYYAACLVYIHNTSNVKVYLEYPQKGKRRFYTPEHMIIDIKDLKCTNVNYNKIKNGHMLIAFGKSYDEIGAVCAENIRKYSHLPILVCTNIPEYLRSKKWLGINNVIFHFFEMNDFDNRVIKTQLSKYTIFDKTMYTDVDSQLQSTDFMFEFEKLNEYDILMPIRAEEVTASNVDDILKKQDKPYKKLLHKLDIHKLNTEKMTVYGGGVCFFNKTNNVDNFFEDFYTFWKVSGRKMDMPALMCAAHMHSNKLRILKLTRKKYNATNSLIVKSIHDTQAILDNESINNFIRARVNPDTNNWEYVKQGSTQFYNKPRITMVYDIPGWAFYYMSHSIKHHLSDVFEFNIVSAANANTVSQDETDVVFLFSHAMRKLVNHIPNRMIITGVSSFKRVYSKRDFEGYKLIHANNIQLVEQLSKIHNNVYYIPNGVDTSFFIKTKKSPTEITVGAVGNINFAQHKGLEFISEICKECNVKYMPLYVDPDNAKSRIEMLEYYNDINVFVVNSKSETGPNPALEAMSCEIPVISNSVGLMPHIITNGYNGFVVNNVEAYINILNSMKKHDIDINRLGNNARHAVLSYDWSIMSLNYKKMWEDFLCSK